MKAQILIIDDDESLTAMLTEYLGKAELALSSAATVQSGMARLRETPFDALILDAMLPDGDGFDVCRELRAADDLPILMLTARGDDTDRIVGLEIGADDYLAKPFNPRELLARLRAMLRRGRGQSTKSSGAWRFGCLDIDRDERTVTVNGKRRTLTGYQFDLLVALASSPGRVLSRDALMNRLRGHDAHVFDRSIDVHISRIRAAIEDDPKVPKRVLTLRGAGYLFVREQD
ncbi:MAG: response regulator [Gammaproteobacteria bacterium]|nr:response regulator [Gammaproteobacteria bacterium]